MAAVAGSAIVVALVGLGSACSATVPREAPAAAATAIAAGPTLVAAGQAAATQVSELAGTADLGRQLAPLLGELSTQVSLEPPLAPPDQIKTVHVVATDSQGRFRALEPAARSRALDAALAVLTHTFPAASIELTVKDASGNVVETVRRQAPTT